MSVTMLQIAELNRGALLRPVDEARVAEIADADWLPPVRVVDVGGHLVLADGEHRCRALERRGAKEVEAIVTPGDGADVLELALAGNAQHGQRLTRAETRRGVEALVRALLELGRVEQVSARKIAKRAGVSHGLAHAIIREVTGREETEEPEEALEAPTPAEGEGAAELVVTPTPPAPAPVTEKPRAVSGDGDEFYTPGDVCELMHEVLGGRPDFDPFSCELANRHVQAKRFLTIHDNAFACEWPSVDRLQANPPFTRVEEAVDALLHHFDVGRARHVWILTNAKTETQWAKKLMRRAKAGDGVCVLVEGRIRFIDGDGEPAPNTGWTGQLITYLGPEQDRAVTLLEAPDDAPRVRRGQGTIIASAEVLARRGMHA